MQTVVKQILYFTVTFVQLVWSLCSLISLKINKFDVCKPCEQDEPYKKLQSSTAEICVGARAQRLCSSRSDQRQRQIQWPKCDQHSEISRLLQVSSMHQFWPLYDRRVQEVARSYEQRTPWLQVSLPLLQQKDRPGLFYLHYSTLFFLN